MSEDDPSPDQVTHTTSISVDGGRFLPFSRPCTCPVCDGRGVVPQGFYENWPLTTVTNTAPDTCRSCGGQGVIHA